MAQRASCEFKKNPGQQDHNSTQEKWIIQHLVRNRRISELSVRSPNINPIQVITWRGIIAAVTHELYPNIGTALKESVEELLQNENMELNAFNTEAVGKVLKNLNVKKEGLLNKEIEYVKTLVADAKRYNDSQSIRTNSINKNDTFFRYNVLNDISDLEPDADLIHKWEGLTANLVVDIYSIFKAMKYGAFQREKYSKIDFLRDIESAESKILRDDAVSSLVEEIDIESAVSFHPQYVIEDDLFETVNPLLAMSLVLNKLESEQIGNGIKIKCVVVPALITSIHEEEKIYEANVFPIMLYLTRQSHTDCMMTDTVSVSTEDIPKTANVIKEMIDYILYRSTSSSKSSSSISSMSPTGPTIFMVFDHSASAMSSTNVPVHVFTVSEQSIRSLADLDNNHFVGMEVTVVPSLETDSGSEVLHKCWLRFGVGERIRFVPEHLVWIIPSLFGRSSTMNQYEFLSRLYGDDYKHRWSVSLRDSNLEKYYHILTQNILCSVNYRRDDVTHKKEGDAVDGLRDHLERTLDVVVLEKMETIILGQRYDSDAVVEDVMVMVMDSGKAKGIDSNICRHFGGRKSRQFHQLKHEVMRYLKTRCDADDKRAVADCPFIEELIRNLIRFEQFGLEIEASNLINFPLSPLVKGLNHLYRVHDYGLEENKEHIRSHVIERIQCHLAAKCPVVQEHGDRKRENGHRKVDRKHEDKQRLVVTKDQTHCEALRDSLCAAHCYLLHNDDELYRLRLATAELRFATAVVGQDTEQKEYEMGIADEKKEDRPREGGPLSINYGESVLEWLSFGESPQFESLREELIHNGDSTINEELLNRMTIQCMAAIEDSNYTLKEALALKTYADATSFQSELRKAHWKGMKIEIKKAFFQWAMALYEAHLYHAKPIAPRTGTTRNPRRLFHGLNRMFMVNHELPTYLGPFSVSTSKMVARQFSNQQGLIFSIAPSYVNPFKFCVGIDMMTFTAFKNEAEVLFNNQPIPVMKTEVFQNNKVKLVTHFLASLKERVTPIRHVPTFFKLLGADWDDDWIPIIANHPLLFEKTDYVDIKYQKRQMNVIDRLCKEFYNTIDLTDSVLLSQLRNTKYKDTTYLDHLINDLNVEQLLDIEQYQSMMRNRPKTNENKQVTWRGIVEAVNQELYPMMAWAFGKSVEECLQRRTAGLTDFDVESMDTVIRELKYNKRVLNKEVDYIKGLATRMVQYNDYVQSKLKANQQFNLNPNPINKNESIFRYRVLNDIRDLDPNADLIPKWKGLTANLVVDIYGIFKAMKYGAFQREKYSKNDFIADIKKAETNMLRDEAVSSLVEEIDIESAVSFHPHYVIKDDLFETVNPLLAMSLVLNKLESEQIGNGIKIKCVVVPALITSIYDEQREFESSIFPVMTYLTQRARTNCIMTNTVSLNTKDMPKTAEVLQNMVVTIILQSQLQSFGATTISSSTESESPAASTIFMVFDRRTYGLSSSTVPVHVFRVWDRTTDSLVELDQNYFVGMEIIVKATSSRPNRKSDAYSSRSISVQCWLLFGMEQRVRFLPEQLVWIIPSLFRRRSLPSFRRGSFRRSTVKAYDFWCELYGDDYKHRWSVSLRDEILAQFHHILLGNVLCTVNYRRDEVAVVEQVQVDGLLDHLERTLDAVLMGRVMPLIAGQCYDSDAVVDDVMVTDGDSNVCVHLNGPNSREWYHFKHGVMRYLRIGCNLDVKREITDCPFVENIIQNLLQFEQFGLEIDASNLFEFSLSPLVKGMDHLYRVHEYGETSGPNRQSIRRHVLEHVRCYLGADCPVVQQHGDRKRENDRRRADRLKETKQQDGDEWDEIEKQCEALRDTLCAAHSYLLHANDELYRLRSAGELRFATEVAGDGEKQKGDEMKSDDTKTDDEVTGDDPLSINYGESVLEWLSWGELPKFESLREELLHNEDSTLDENILDQMTIQCAAAIESTDYTLKEALGLKTYADTTAFQYELRKAHWKGISIEIKRAYFNWAMTLYEAHLYHAKPIPTRPGTQKPRAVYHGLNRMFSMKHELPIFLGPFSVSSKKTVAKQFSNENGLLFTIAPSYANPFKFSVGIDMITFSSFKNEAEVLFNNQPIWIQEAETFGDAMMRLVDHFLFSLKNRQLRINDITAFYNKLGVDWNDEWIPIVLKHKLLFKKTQCNSLRVIDRLLSELNIMDQRLVDPILEMMHHDGRPYVVYLVEDVRVKQLLPHYRLMTSGFLIQQYCKEINSSWLKWESNDKMNDMLGVNGVDDACFDGAEYRINEKSMSSSVHFVADFVRSVAVRQPRFFGDRWLPIHDQGLPKIQEDEYVPHHFQALLKVNDYNDNSITIDEFKIPPMKYDLRIGQIVQIGIVRTLKIKEIEVWVEGMVSRLFSSKICVRTIDGDFMSYQWVQKDDIRLSTKQCNEKSDLIFTAIAGTSNKVQRVPRSREFSFDNLKNFLIPADEIVAYSNSPDVVYIYAKPRNEKLKYGLVAQLKCNKLSFSKFAVNDTFHFEGSYQTEARFEVLATSDIIIPKAAAVDVMCSGLDRNSKSNTAAAVILNYGEYIGDTVKNNKGIICLISGGKVINEGNLVCKAPDAEHLNDGCVYIDTDGVFMNKGLIDSGKNGFVHIKCSRFNNEGVIIPSPTITLKNNKENQRGIVHVAKDNGLQLIKLMVSSYAEDSGTNVSDSDGIHPKNLLQKGKEQYYRSLDKPASAIWFIFRAYSDPRVYPANIVIRNSKSFNGLKSIQIEGSADGMRFYDWIQIGNISNAHDELQTFAVDPTAGYFAWERAYAYFKVTILENYGGQQNEFYEFRINGMDKW